MGNIKNRRRKGREGCVVKREVKRRWRKYGAFFQ